MSPFPESLEQAVARLVVPTAYELLTARAVILDVLADEATHHDSEFVTSAIAALGVRGGTQEPLTVTGSDPQVLTGDEPQLASKRARYAVLDSLGTLVRDGVVFATVGTSYGEETDSVPFRQVFGSSSTAGSIQFPVHHATFGARTIDCRWRLAVRRDAPRMQLARADMADGLEGVLGVRGVEVLQEAIQCFHRGRFLAAVDLLAAASEAAWFGVASAAAGADTKLDSLVARGEMIAEVIERTTAALATCKILSNGTRNDLRAQGARFRDLRNYGLHPVGDRDHDREAAFTEPGCAVLFMTARRYFQQLDDARRALAVAP